MSVEERAVLAAAEGCGRGRAVLAICLTAELRALCRPSHWHWRSKGVSARLGRVAWTGRSSW